MTTSLIVALRDAIRASPFSQAKLARAAGMQPQWLTDLFHGRRRLLADEFLRLCEAAKLDPMAIWEKAKGSTNGTALPT